VVARLQSTSEPDEELCLFVGVGDLESLLRYHEEELWDAIEQLARGDIRFRRALSAAWAYDSPMYDRREALLAELGEHREITVRFTVEPIGFGEDPELDWRALEQEGEISNSRLAGILRSVADRLDGTDAPGPTRG
jgi:hypothetical protein